MEDYNNKNKEKQFDMFNLTDQELDERLKEEMRRQGYTTFFNFQGVEEPL